MKKQKRMTLTLGPLDAAIVFPANGAIHLIVPDRPEYEVAATNVENAMRCGMLFKVPGALALVNEEMDKIIADERQKRGMQ